MYCVGRWLGYVVAALGIGLLIGGLLPCCAVKWLCGLLLILAGVLLVRQR